MAIVEHSQLGKYRIIRELGRGGFATVYEAEDTQLTRRVALKILHPALMTDPKLVRLFTIDARTAASFDHPHIATIYEYGQEQSRLFIAQQFLSGGTLAERIATRGPLPFTEVVRITAEIASALDEAHARGLIHRDVKPANILFNVRDQAVLTDFGLVRTMEQSVIARSNAGGMVGTPAYLAPEIWEGQPGGPATDIYALGCVLFEMLTGHMLFDGPTAPAVMNAHFRPRRFPDTWPDGVPDGVLTVLVQALNLQAKERFTSAGAVAKALLALSTNEASDIRFAQPPISEPRSQTTTSSRVDNAGATNARKPFLPRQAEAMPRQAETTQPAASTLRRNNRTLLEANSYWQFLALWTLAAVVACGVGVPALFELVTAPYRPPEFTELHVSLIFGVAFGVVIGVLQWLSLRGRSLVGKRWIVVTCMGYALGAFLTLGWISYLGDILVGQGGNIFLAYFLILLPMGFVTGTSQWVVLRQHSVRAIWWIPATMLVLCVSSSVSLGIATAIINMSGSNVLDFAFVGVVGGLIYGICTAVALIWLDRSG